MSTEMAMKIVEDYERGKISRRQMVAQLMGAGAAMATLHGAAGAQEVPDVNEAQGTPNSAQGEPERGPRPTFRATGLHHIALDVTDIPRSRDFYVQHLGLQVIRGDNNALFLGQSGNFFLTLFRRDRAAFNHYSYAIPDYDAGAAVDRLAAAGLQPRRSGNRVYFPDPDGYTVQVSQEYEA